MAQNATTRLKRRCALLLAATLIVFAATGWIWLAPHDRPSCVGESVTPACLSRVALELTPIGFEAVRAERSFALSPDGTTLVVALTSARQSDSTLTGAVAAFNTSTGRHLRTYLASQTFNEIEQLAFSPDGSLLAVSFVDAGTNVQAQAGSGLAAVHLYITDSTEIRLRLGTSCDYGLGISKDNSRLQCESGIFDALSGQFIESVSDENRLASVSLNSRVFMPTGMVAKATGRELVLAKQRVDEGRIPYRHHIASMATSRHLESAQDQSRVAMVSVIKHPWWRPLPQRSAGALTLFDLVALTHIATVKIKDEPVGVTFSIDGDRVAVVDAGLRVHVFSTRI